MCSKPTEEATCFEDVESAATSAYQHQQWRTAADLWLLAAANRKEEPTGYALYQAACCQALDGCVAPASVPTTAERV
jgi:hypothetical protein